MKKLLANSDTTTQKLEIENPKVIAGAANAVTLSPVERAITIAGPLSAREWIIRNQASLIVSDSIEQNGWRVLIEGRNAVIVVPTYALADGSYSIARRFEKLGVYKEEEMGRFNVVKRSMTKKAPHQLEEAPQL